ncbi:MAG TPA: hypothetical protein PK286_04865 [Devosia sp.]|nr:hypothetical protein [Devosia sp.]
MHNYVSGMLGAAVVTVALATGAQAAGNLASQPTRLETKIDGPGKTWTGNDFQLEVGKYYIWEITSDGIEETLITAPELFRNSWFNQVVINDKEIHSSGAFYGFEYDAAGTISVSFVPVRPGEYTFSAPGFENMTGKFTVTGDALTSNATPIELSIDTAKLVFSQTEIELETGKPYRLDVTSDGIEELGVMMPELFRNSWINQLVVDDLEVKVNGAISSIEFDDEGMISISFVPLRPGNYSFYAPGFEKAGLTGTFVVR